VSRPQLGAVLLAVVPVVALSAPVPKEGTTPFVKWSVTAEPVTNEFHDPLVVGNLVVAGNDRGTLAAYRIKDGSRAWAHEDGKRIFHRPCADGERVYFTSDNGLTAVAADTGRKVWTFAVNGDGGPAVAVPGRGLVVVAGSDGRLHGVAAKTGESLWESDYATDAPKDPPGFDGNRARVQGKPARPSALTTDGDAVFLSVFDQCRVVAAEAKTGKRLWSFQTGGWVFGDATRFGDHVFVGSQDDKLYCLDRKTGAKVWEFATKGRIESGCVADDEAAYIPSCDGGLYAVDRATGKQRWRFQADAQANGKRTAIYSTPVLRGGYLTFAAGEGQVYAVDAKTGQLRWKIRAEAASELFCSPASDGANFFVTSRPTIEKTGASALVAIGLK
jgi:outer membrane protein assembly factor BamB